jgi:hypothetical protein
MPRERNSAVGISSKERHPCSPETKATGLPIPQAEAPEASSASVMGSSEHPENPWPLFIGHITQGNAEKSWEDSTLSVFCSCGFVVLCSSTRQLGKVLSLEWAETALPSFPKRLKSFSCRLDL